MLISLMLLNAMPQDIGWSSYKLRVGIDRSFRSMAANCDGFGFKRLIPASPDEMQKRIYAYLLLKEAYAADARVDEWGGLVRELNRLADKDYIERSSRGAGDALAAAKIDPTAKDAAKVKFVAELVRAMTPFFEACEKVAKDDFLSKHYLSGEGSLDSYRAEAEADFEKALAGLDD